MNLKETISREGDINVSKTLHDMIEYMNTGVDFLMLKVLNKEPTKRRNGMVVLADGTNWNPGSGAGYYGYNAGAWVKLG